MIRPKSRTLEIAAYSAVACPLAAQADRRLPPEDLIADAREQWKKSGEQLRKVKIPIGRNQASSFVRKIWPRPRSR